MDGQVLRGRVMERGQVESSAARRPPMQLANPTSRAIEVLLIRLYATDPPPAMRVIKSLGVALLATVLGMIATVAVLMAAGYALMWIDISTGGGSVGGFTIAPLQVLVGLTAGIVGFTWQWRRGRRPARSA